MFIKLHDATGLVHLTEANHIVDMSPAPAARTDFKTRLTMIGGTTLLVKESMAEVYSLCDGRHANDKVMLDDDMPRPWGAEQLTPAWVQAIEAQIQAVKKP